MASKVLPRLAVPHQDTTNPAPISQKQRLALLRRLLADEEPELPTRVAAILMLLYAHPYVTVDYARSPELPPTPTRPAPSASGTPTP